MQININETSGTVEGYLLQTDSDTFQTFCQKNVTDKDQDMNRVRNSIENDRITVVSQFDPEMGAANELMSELKTSAMGTPILVVVDPFASPIDGSDQRQFFMDHGFEEIDVHSGQGQVMVFK